MKRTTWVLPGLLVAVCAVGAAEDATGRAMRLDVGRGPFQNPAVVMQKSYPPKFVIVLTREMPTPGYRFDVDSLELDEERGRVVARVTEVRPEGMVAQVITKAELRLPIGSPKTGRYVLELWTRRGTEGRHQLTQAMVLVASPQ